MSEEGRQALTELVVYLRSSGISPYDQELVLRLERNGLIRADYRSSELGPRRKYYALTQTGRAALGDFLTHYRALERAVSRLIEETEKLEVQADE